MVVYDEHFIEIFRGGCRQGVECRRGADCRQDEGLGQGDSCRRGSGVRLTREFALTAAHCLKARELKGLDLVMLRLSDGKQVMGQVLDYDRRSDLALLNLTFAEGEDVRLPGVCFDDARQDEVWKATHQPPDTDDVLTGSVADVSYEYGDPQKGVKICALRLNCHAGMDDYTKFAGSPVERGDPYRPTAVLGLIVERRADAGTAGDTVFAGTIREAVRQFDRFRFRVEDLARDQWPLSVRPYSVEASETEQKLRINAAVADALKKSGQDSVVSVHWIRR
ncbi:trypsin-like peptidase domain-containing protein [Streptomyces sp. Je 1-369]|uniref:trypsin-like peptidase domain-containing protein n=1 Tax=Streptomyces sp. Je 1-369 TaxID=2966192 RepID=UPI002286C3FD|nr:trypsin-like peptidase domain-containing protein [Streptomyces sp. Je 1-369]WAL95698.1 serine protease [Streptomyces sp. Je 1-369]